MATFKSFAKGPCMQMICAGHYATETFGVKALAKAMKKALRVETVFIPRPDIPNLQPQRLP